MQRLRQSLALHSADPMRREVSDCLVSMLTACGVDRIAAVYLDEFEASRINALCVIDLVSDVPRRTFDEELIRSAWTGGVPSIYEESNPPTSGVIGPASTFAISIGSDGGRSWFIVGDSQRAIAPISEATTDELFFKAGQIAAAVLHADLGDRGLMSGAWPMLEDLKGNEEDAEESRRIASRFVVARALRIVAGQAGTPEQLRSQAGIIRDELGALKSDDSERRVWEGFVQALENQDWVILGALCVELGTTVEARGHRASAEELFSIGYDLAVRAGSVSVAIDAARFKARAFRRKGGWDEAEELYNHARDLARSAHDHERHGLVISGLAAVARTRGNLPRSRDLLMAQLQIGTAEGLDSVLAAAYHDLMAVDKLAGDHESALVHGWEAVRHNKNAEGMLKVMADLADVLTRLGHLTAAEDAYAIVAAKVQHQLYRLAALEGLSHVSALRGNREQFEERVASADTEGWGSIPEATRAEFLYSRGLSYRALGDADAAAEYLKNSRELSQAKAVNRVFFDADAALQDLIQAVARRRAAEEGAGDAPPAFRRASNIGAEIRSMRESLIGV